MPAATLSGEGGGTEDDEEEEGEEGAALTLLLLPTCAGAAVAGGRPLPAPQVGTRKGLADRAEAEERPPMERPRP